MRARKFSLCADTFEDYKQQAIAQVASSESTQTSKSPRSIRSLNISSCRLLASSQEEKLAFISNSPKRRNPWENFDYSAIANDDSTSTEATDNASESISDRDFVKSPLKKVKTSTMKRFMVLGTGNAGKHQLVNSLFNSESTEAMDDGQTRSLDLITKTDSEAQYATKYQFWLKNLDNNSFEDIAKMYYKRVSMFFFVYSVQDHRSFEALKSSIQQVQNHIDKENFFGVVVGNKADSEKREVSFEAGVALREQFGLNHFVETDCHDKELRGRFESLL